MPALPDPIRSALLQSILERSATDPEFRRRLLERPNDAIRTEFGVRVIDDFRVRFIEKPRELDALVVLPELRAVALDGELSEHDLEQVVGGTDGGGITWEEEPPPPPPPPPAP